MLHYQRYLKQLYILVVMQVGPNLNSLKNSNNFIYFTWITFFLVSFSLNVCFSIFYLVFLSDFFHHPFLCLLSNNWSWILSFSSCIVFLSRNWYWILSFLRWIAFLFGPNLGSCLSLNMINQLNFLKNCTWFVQGLCVHSLFM